MTDGARRDHPLGGEGRSTALAVRDGLVHRLREYNAHNDTPRWLTNVKRMLAYSSSRTAGYVMVALASRSEVGIAAAMSTWQLTRA